MCYKYYLLFFSHLRKVPFDKLMVYYLRKEHFDIINGILPWERKVLLKLIEFYLIKRTVKCLRKLTVSSMQHIQIVNINCIYKYIFKCLHLECKISINNNSMFYTTSKSMMNCPIVCLFSWLIALKMYLYMQFMLTIWMCCILEMY
jgi:hypothetical protein